ncbi:MULTISPECIES: BRO family protein [Pseudomonas]|uniref:BRO-N domain-containing protein n=1 Tax=Pseudomonadaceae TaxID=135621 RepID=UPI000410A034|nr:MULTISPECIES: BRO family protein [Pseudomonas]MDE3736195.1 BRO family protein [Pseudomonas resinovorans]
MTLPEITPQVFRRHRRPLRAFLIGHEAWFSARDLRRLLNTDINDRLIGRLCPDQHRRVLLKNGSSLFNEETVISESGLHALLWMYCYHPENRLLRRWVSQEVVRGLWGQTALAG